MPINPLCGYQVLHVHPHDSYIALSMRSWMSSTLQSILDFVKNFRIGGCIRSFSSEFLSFLWFVLHNVVSTRMLKVGAALGDTNTNTEQWQWRIATIIYKTDL
jgi:hypothetical protein